ncbi:hypothetical protein IFM89_006746 [Coptis chinensis]|uniref:Secreted protein n=1 Tax=Coptis chinensis TaxID=261450 RepID=A0A835LV54_9MAGN|nr:hypothetical protein IFM89_006746 [Coptis chinensis]
MAVASRVLVFVVILIFCLADAEGVVRCGIWRRTGKTGTAGNRELCGSCYTNMKTHGNRALKPPMSFHIGVTLSTHHLVSESAWRDTFATPTAFLTRSYAMFRPKVQFAPTLAQ